MLYIGRLERHRLLPIHTHPDHALCIAHPGFTLAITGKTYQRVLRFRRIHGIAEKPGLFPEREKAVAVGKPYFRRRSFSYQLQNPGSPNRPAGSKTRKQFHASGANVNCIHPLMVERMARVTVSIMAMARLLPRVFSRGGSPGSSETGLPGRRPQYRHGKCRHRYCPACRP